MRTLRIITAVFVTLAFVFIRPVAGQQIRATAEVDSFTYRIGDWIHARLTVDADWNCRVLFPTDTAFIQGAEIVSADPETVVEENGRRIVHMNFVLAAFDTGRVELVFTIPFTMGSDTTRNTVTTDPLYLTIHGTEVDTTQTFRDIKDVMHVGLTIWDYMLYAGIALVLAAVGWWLYRRWKRRRAARPEPVQVEPEAPVVPAHIIALERLGRLESEHLWQAGRHKQFQSELTDIIREYIERKLAIPALEETTGEIVEALTRHGLTPELVQTLRTALVTADRTKFARYTPTQMEHEAGIRTGYDFVDATRSLPDPQEKRAPRAPDAASPAGPDTAAMPAEREGGNV